MDHPMIGERAKGPVVITEPATILPPVLTSGQAVEICRRIHSLPEAIVKDALESALVKRNEFSDSREQAAFLVYVFLGLVRGSAILEEKT